MKKFWELYQQSIIITGTLTVVVVVGFVYMSCRQIPIAPDYLMVTIGCLSFFFGSKAGFGSRRAEDNVNFQRIAQAILEGSKK